MAAAVVPDPTFSALYDDPSKWTHPTLDYEYYTERVGNCWTFQVSFVVCTDSFVGSKWASDFDLGRSWRPSCLSYVLGSGVSKIFVSLVCSVLLLLWVLLGGVT